MTVDISITFFQLNWGDYLIYIYIHCKWIPTIKLINTSFTSYIYLFIYFLIFGENTQVLPFQQISIIQYSIISYSHHVISYVFRLYSSYNWKFVPFYQPLLFPQPPSSWQPPFYPLFLCVQIFLKWYHTVFVFGLFHLAYSYCLPGLPMLLQMAEFPSFSWLNNIPFVYSVPHLLYIFICHWTLRLSPYLGYCK